jgi:hypothetical protein
MQGTPLQGSNVYPYLHGEGTTGGGTTARWCRGCRGDGVVIAPRKEWYSHEDRGRRRKRLVLDPLLIDFLFFFNFLNFKNIFSMYTYSLKIDFLFYFFKKRCIPIR